MLPNIITIAVDVSDTTFIENYRIGVFHGVIHYARSCTHWKLVFNVACFSLREKFESYDDLPALGVNGIVFTHWRNPNIAKIREMGIPAVSVSNVPPEWMLPCVTTDDIEVGRAAAQHLIERGFQHFAFCGSDEREWEKQRAVGFQETVELAGYKCEFFRYDLTVNDSTIGVEGERRAANELGDWIVQQPRPLGILGSDDTRALHALEACLNRGIKVPNEVGIVGVDNNLLICNTYDSSLSSVEANAERVGYEAAALLDRLIHGEEVRNMHIVVPPKGVVTRASSDVLAVDDGAVAKALVFIQENIDQLIGTNEVVEASGISRSNLERRFRQRLNTSINAVIRERRLERAKSLLLETSLSLDEIARASGFRRSTYLANLFTSQFGIPPGAWRNRQKGLPK